MFIFAIIFFIGCTVAQYSPYYQYGADQQPYAWDVYNPYYGIPPEPSVYNYPEPIRQGNPMQNSYANPQPSLYDLWRQPPSVDESVGNFPATPQQPRILMQPIDEPADQPIVQPIVPSSADSVQQPNTQLNTQPHPSLQEPQITTKLHGAITSGVNKLPQGDSAEATPKNVPLIQANTQPAKSYETKTQEPLASHSHKTHPKSEIMREKPITQSQLSSYKSNGQQNTQAQPPLQHSDDQQNTQAQLSLQQSNEDGNSRTQLAEVKPNDGRNTQQQISHQEQNEQEPQIKIQPADSAITSDINNLNIVAKLLALLDLKSQRPVNGNERNSEPLQSPKSQTKHLSSEQNDQAQSPLKKSNDQSNSEELILHEANSQLNPKPHYHLQKPNDQLSSQPQFPHREPNDVVKAQPQLPVNEQNGRPITPTKRPSNDQNDRQNLQSQLSVKKPNAQQNIQQQPSEDNTNKERNIQLQHSLREPDEVGKTTLQFSRNDRRNSQPHLSVNELNSPPTSQTKHHSNEENERQNPQSQFLVKKSEGQRLVAPQLSMRQPNAQQNTQPQLSLKTLSNQPNSPPQGLNLCSCPAS